MNRNSTSIDLRHDEETNTYLLLPNGLGSIGTEIILAIADLTGTDPLEMKPLSNFLDADLADELFRADWQTGKEASFDYLGFHVTVSRSGEVLLKSNSAYSVWIDQNSTVNASWSS